jgi:hypothetical protein
MKIVLDYKKGWFGKFRKLKIYLDGDIHLTDMKQGQRTEVEIPEETESLFGKMDWAKTEKIKIEDLSEGDGVEMIPYFSWKHAQSYRSFGKKSLPIRIVIRNKDGFQKHISPETQ